VSKTNRFFPEQCISRFFDKMAYCTLGNLKADAKYSMVMIMHIIGEDHLDHPALKQFIPEAVKLLVLGIAEYPSYRSNFLVFLKRIVYDHFDDFEDLLRKDIGREAIQELMYLLENLPNERATILLIFECLIR
jgi:hypothetical protein